jgi:hypothetical protein
MSSYETTFFTGEMDETGLSVLLLKRVNIHQDQIVKPSSTYTKTRDVADQPPTNWEDHTVLVASHLQPAVEISLASVDWRDRATESVL